MKKFSRNTAMVMAATMVLSGLSVPPSISYAKEQPMAVVENTTTDALDVNDIIEEDNLDVQHSSVTQVVYQSVYDTKAEGDTPYQTVSFLKDGDDSVNQVVIPRNDTYPLGNPTTVSIENAPLKKAGTYIVYDGALEEITDATKLTEENKEHFTTYKGLNGWDVNNNCPILYNVYEADGTYTIHFQPLGGGYLNGAGDVTVEFGKSISSMPSDKLVALNGYKFAKWQLANGDEITADTVFNGLDSKEITVYANFEKITNVITVNFYSNYSIPYTISIDNCDTEAQKTVLYNQMVEDAKRVGYKLDKFVKKDGTIVTASNFNYKNSMTLDAVYSPIISYHHVNYHVGDVTTVADISNKAIVDITIPDADATLNFNYLDSDLNNHTTFTGANHTWAVVDKVSGNTFRAICLGEEDETGDDIIELCDNENQTVSNLQTNPWTAVLQRANGENVENVDVVATQVTLISQSGNELQQVNKAGYQFDGWFKEPSCKNKFENFDDCKEADVHLYAGFTAIDYTITLDAGEGALAEGVADSYTYNVEEGFADTKKDSMVLPIPTREHYEFTGWMGTDENDNTFQISSVFAKTACQNYDLTASWKPVQYRISYDLSGGNVDGAPLHHAFEEDVVIPNPTKAGYTFAGWFLDSDYQTPLQNIGSFDETVTLYAKWGERAYTISYELNGGKGDEKNPTSYIMGKQPLFYNPVKENYSFMGWFTDKEMTKEVTEADFVSAQDLTLYAKWQGNKFNLTYKFNGANVIDEPSYFRFGTAPKLESPIRDGYVFTGWYFDENCTKAVTDDATEWSTASNRTLYAGWKGCSYKITYKLNGGSIKKAPQSYVYKEPANIPKASRKGYTFAGWYLDSKCKTKVTDSSYNTTGDKTFYAKWEKCKPGLSKIKKLKSSSKGKVTVSIKKQNGIDGYQVRYATNKNFDGAKTKKAGTSVTLKNLTSGKVYFMQVRTYVVDSAGKKVYSKWSKIKTVRVK